MSKSTRLGQWRRNAEFASLLIVVGLMVSVCIQTLWFQYRSYLDFYIESPVICSVGVTIWINDEGYYLVIIGSADDGVAQHGPLKERRVMGVRNAYVSYRRPNCEYHKKLSHAVEAGLGYVGWDDHGMYVLNLRWFTILVLSAGLGTLAGNRIIRIVRGDRAPFACMKCGYDCRMSKYQCPECGAEKSRPD